MEITINAAIVWLTFCSLVIIFSTLVRWKLRNVRRAVWESVTESQTYWQTECERLSRVLRGIQSNKRLPRGMLKRIRRELRQS